MAAQFPGLESIRTAAVARLATVRPFALLIGTLQLSRSLSDQRAADAVLEQGIQNALALLGRNGR